MNDQQKAWEAPNLPKAQYLVIQDYGMDRLYIEHYKDGTTQTTSDITRAWRMTFRQAWRKVDELNKARRQSGYSPNARLIVAPEWQDPHD